MKNAVIIGAGTQGQVYASYLKEAGINLIGFIDDSPDLIGKEILNIPILGKYEDLFLDKFKKLIQDVYCPIGINSVRVKYLSTLKKEGYNIPNFIHSSVSIAPDVIIGEGVYMLVGNIIMPHTKIGNYFMVNMDSTIAHHVNIEDGVFLSSGVNVGASINIRKNAYIGMGVTIMTGVKEVGKETLVGAGTVIIKNIPNYATMVGNPGRMIKLRYSDITFIGSGISTSFTILNFLNEIEITQNKYKTKITVFEKYKEFNTGIPYGERSGYSTLLITSLKDFLIEPERIKFVKWLNKNKDWLLEKLKEEGDILTQKWLDDFKINIDNNDWDDLFIPRRFFGHYIDQTLKEKIESLTNKDIVEVNYINAEVIDIEKSDNDFKIYIKNNLPFFSKKVILSIGSLPTKHLWKNSDIIKKINLLFLNKPYYPGLKYSLNEINTLIKQRGSQKTNILIIGANASALEIIYKINDVNIKNQNLNFTFLSTHGKLPDDKIDSEKVKKYNTSNLNQLVSEKDLTADKIANATYADIRSAEKMNLGAASTVGIISKAFGALLENLTHSELERFACLYGNDIGRHQRCAGPHYLNNIRHLESRKRFKHIAGRFINLIEDKNAQYYLEYRDTSSNTNKENKDPFHIVINCIGGQNLKDENIPELLKNLISKGFCKPNDSNIGFHVNKYLEASKNLYIMGPLLAGNVIDNKAVWHVEHCGRIIWLSKVLAKQINSIPASSGSNYSIEIKDFHGKKDINEYKSLLKKYWKNNVYYSINHIKYFANKNNILKYFVFTKNEVPIILMPFILRVITINGKKQPYYDAFTPYGYSGPLYNEIDIGESDLKVFWEFVDQWYKNNDVVTEFIRFNLSKNYKEYSGHLISTLNNVKGKLIDFDTCWANFKQKVRNNYRKAVSHNLNSIIYSNPIEDKILDRFYTIFIKTMARNEAKKDYLYTKSYFKKLIKNHLKDTFIIIVYKDNIPVSSELLIRVDDVLYSYLGGTLSDYFSMRPNDFLKIEVVKWAIENNIKYYSLGGGRKNNDGLYKYKKTFFPIDEDSVFYTGRKVINHDVYDSLIKEIKVNYTNVLDYIQDSATYFPIYNEGYYKKIDTKDFEKLLKTRNRK